MGKILTVSPSPHIHDNVSTRRLMGDVIIALTPALLVSIYFFGFRALLVTAVSTATCVGLEWLLQKYAFKTKTTIGDLSAVVTGILLALNLPSGLPLYMVVAGAAFAAGVAKISFGGLGNNTFNPAIAGRIFLLISFPAAMGTWLKPAPLFASGVDAVTGATPLGLMGEGLAKGLTPAQVMAENGLSYAHLLYGEIGGSFGEVSAAALLLGFAYLLIRRVISWHIPLTIFATVAVFTGIMHLLDSDKYASPLFHLLTGGIMLGAIFMATDYVTSPMTKRGMLIFAFGIGAITCVIRLWGAYPEGISFAILIMNAVVPLINIYVKPKLFGERVKR